MNTGSFTKTAFCGKKIDNVTDNKTKEFILKDLSLKTNKNYNSRYAKILNENYMKNLKNKHIVNVKTGGAPYLLYITEINGNDYTFLIDKKIKQESAEATKALGNAIDDLGLQTKRKIRDVTEDGIRDKESLRR